MSIQELEAEILQLNLKDRASLLEKILLSFDELNEAENLEIWAKEAEKRSQQIKDGTAETLSIDEVYAKVRSALDK
ncbi:MAG: addiction module protein [Chloroflexota bacterium]